MTEANSASRTAEIVAAHHSQIAAFARKACPLEGRGVVHIRFPPVPTGATIVGITGMNYITLVELRRIGSGQRAKDAGSDIVVQMVESYDPDQQVVVMAAIDGENPISVKMRLDPSMIVDDAPGVH